MKKAIIMLAVLCVAACNDKLVKTVDDIIGILKIGLKGCRMDLDNPDNRKTLDTLKKTEQEQ